MAHRTSPPRPETEPARDLELARASRDDPEAFGVLYDLYVDRVYRFVRARLRDSAAAEDVTAEVFFKALRGISGYRPESGTFSGWLFRIARNAVIDHVRARRPTVSLEHAYGTFDAAASVEDQVAHRVEMTRVRREIDELPPAQRTAIILRLERDLPIAEIAVALSRSEGAVRVLLHRALRTLRTKLGSSIASPTAGGPQS
jgi:RNA polymerase sigma-70 factor (ECF subfamily)